MQLAIWDTPPAEFLVAGLASGLSTEYVEVERRPAERCADLLRERAVDVALVPTLDVLREPRDFDVLPAVALSSWSFPYARLLLREGLQGKVNRLAGDPRRAQELVVAQMILREHYGAVVEVEPVHGGEIDDLLAADAEAVLLTGTDAPLFQHDGLLLDLGQEWYELAQYPMVWGLFATAKDEATTELIHAVRDVVIAAEAQRALWVRAQEMPAALHDFYREGLRVRFDDLAVAGLTEYRHQLFYQQFLGDVPDLPVVYLPDDEEDDDPEVPRPRL